MGKVVAFKTIGMNMNGLGSVIITTADKISYLEKQVVMDEKSEKRYNYGIVLEPNGYVFQIDEGTYRGLIKKLQEENSKPEIIIKQE